MLDEAEKRVFSFMLGELKHEFPDFVDFQSPGDKFTQEELQYKRKALFRFQDEIGRHGISDHIRRGKGKELLKKLGSILTLNLSDFSEWKSTFGSKNSDIVPVFQALLAVSNREYEGPQTLDLLFEAIESRSLDASWACLSTSLWALNPREYFPIKISYLRHLADRFSLALPSGRPTAESYNELMAFGYYFRDLIAELKPKDWIDVQSFFWSVAYSTMPKNDLSSPSSQ
ncbi:MAG: hypothetical protein JW971_06480 [Synergistales bacterium]|nr:hypothetical protein [Synergistales bacterium]